MGRRYKTTEKPTLKHVDYNFIINNVHELVGPKVAAQWDIYRWWDWSELLDEIAGNQGLTKADMNG